MRKHLYKVIIMLIIPIGLFANETSNTKELEENYKTLKQAIENQKVTDKNLEEKLNNRIDAIAIENKNLYVVYVVSVVGVITIVGFWISVPRIVKNKIHKETEAQFQKHSEFYSKMIEEFRNSVDIRDESKILIITTQIYTSKAYFIRHLLKDTGFSKLTYATPKESIEYKNFDCILFDNDNGEIDEEFMLNVISLAGDNLSFIYYNTCRKHIAHEHLIKCMNYANSKYQLYGNLMNTLIAHKVLSTYSKIN